MIEEKKKSVTIDLYLTGSALVTNGLVNLPESSSKLIHLHCVLQSILQEGVVMGHLVHQLVDDDLEADSFLKLVPGEGGGEQHEGGKVEGVSVKLILSSHADS